MRAALGGRAGRDPQPGRDRARGSTCSNPLSGYLRARRRRCGSGPSSPAAGTSARPSDDARPVGWIVERLAELLARASCAGTLDDGAAPARGALPRARLLARPRRGSAGRRAGTSTRRSRASSTGTRRCATGADMRARHARADRGASTTRPRPAAHDARPRCRFCGAPLEHVVRRPRHVAAGELLPAARARSTRWSRSIRCTRSSARSASSCSSRSSRRPSRSSPTTPTSRRSRRRWLEHARRYAEQMIERFGLGRRQPGRRDRQQRRLPAAVLRRARHPGARHRAGRQRRRGRRSRRASRRVVEFFGARRARELGAASRQADLLLGNNVLAHVPDLNDFVARHEGRCSSPAASITMEFPHLLRLIEENQFDTIYHEHFSYFSFLTVERVFARARAARLRRRGAADARRLAAHLRAATPTTTRKPTSDARRASCVERERRRGLRRPRRPTARFGERVQRGQARAPRRS